jgi:hypothetical protein
MSCSCVNPGAANRASRPREGRPGVLPHVNPGAANRASCPREGRPGVLPLHQPRSREPSILTREGRPGVLPLRLRGRSLPKELHQPRFPTGGVVAVNDALPGCLVQRADGRLNTRRRFGRSGVYRASRLLHECASRGLYGTVPQSPFFCRLDVLEGRFGVGHESTFLRLL